MAIAELTDDRSKIEIITSYADRFLIRQLPGATYSKLRQTWQAPLSWSACVTLRGLFGESLEIGPALTEWAWAQRVNHIVPALEMRNALGLREDMDGVLSYLAGQLAVIEEKSDRKLLPYQAADALFMTVGRHGTILANPMGTGKTGSMIRTVQLLKLIGENPFPALVICPNTVKLTWALEIFKFAPDIEPVVIGGPAGARRKAIASDGDVFIINWEALRIHSRLAGYGSMSVPENEKAAKDLNERGFRTVICDEAHHAKDPHSKQTRAMWAIMHDAEFRFLLTGTPIVNSIGDLWSLLHGVRPSWFPAKTKYLERWATVELGFYGGAEILGIRPDTAAEFRAVTDPLIRRIPKEAALPMLPAKLDTMYRFTEMSPTQAKMYRQMEADMAAEVEADGAVITAVNAISRLTRLLQFASASATLQTEKIIDPETGEERETSHVLLASPSSKVDDLVELLDEMGDEPLVVAAMSSQLIGLAAARLAAEGISHGLITGAQSMEERQQAITMFQACQLRVILLTIDAGGEGITLTRARTLLFMQRHWSKVRNDQVEDRVHRIGQEFPVQIIDQITPDTVEFRKLQVVQEKGERIEEFLQDKTFLLRLLGAE